MNTRTINNRRQPSALRARLRIAVAVLTLSAGARLHAGGEYEEARLSAGDRARNLAVSHEVEELLKHKEAEVAVKRRQGITLLETYLREHGPTPETAEVIFQLAELKWEEAKSQFLAQMGAYNSAVEECAKQKQKGPCHTPAQPALDLTSSQSLYKRLLGEYPDFRKTDAVLYLYGFSLRGEGKLDQALVQFKRILNEHPRSRFRPDAWMAVAESRFYDDSDYKSALAGYDEVLKYPDSPLYDLALFKTAWCYWKLGDSDRAARRFKEVLDLGSGVNSRSQARAHQLTESGRKRLEELKGEALDYLVQVFTEDERKGPKDAFDFLASIGGAGYSRKVIARLADTFFSQARYERAIESERFLIHLDPNDEVNPDRQKRIVEALREMDQNKEAVRELRKLAESYGPGSDWAKAQQNAQAVEHAHKVAAAMLREVAKELHAEAQKNEQQQKGHIDSERYGRAADAYSYYLTHFESDADAPEVHYLLGDIYFFKLKKYEESGDQYLAVGRARPVGKLHREALLQAISSYEKVRRDHSGGGGKKELLPSDKRMGEAIDLYATLFPQDPEIAGVLFKNGQLFYDYGDYDEAVKRFGLIVEKYPKNQVATAAGDKILESLNKAHDYENVESWARRLLKVPAFQSKGDQERLSKLVVDAGMKAGEQKAESNPIGAAEIYQRVAAEFPASTRATAALTNAATLYAKAGRPEEAVKIDAVLVEKYPTASEAPQAAWAAGRLYEQAALWEQAARFYQTLADHYPKDPHAADALFNAGLLREHLGDTQAAITAYSQYSQRYKQRDDARQVAFRVGVVYAESGQHEAAAKAFGEYALRYSNTPQTIEAFSRQGAEYVAAGQDKRAAGSLKEAVALYRRGADHSSSSAAAAAHARYLEGETLFHDFERVKLASDPKRLKRTLDEKSTLMEKAKSAYVDVVTFNDPEWATAALYRIGDAYERFAKALRDAPVPKELNADEQQVYRDELEKVVVVVEEKAIDAYKGGYQKALQLGVYNEFTQKLRAALGRMSDQEFPAENEARARPSAAEPRMNLPFVSAVQR